MYKLIALVTLMSFSLFVSAQQKQDVKVKKEKHVVVDVDNDTEDKKSVTVDIDEDNGQRTVTIKTIEEGKEKVMKWKDDGNIPAEVKEQLEENGIDIQMLENDQAIFISDDDTDIEKDIIIIKKEGDEIEEYDWDGEGEMPESIKMIMDEHDIDLSEIRKQAKGKKMRMRMMKKEIDGRGPHRMHKKGKGERYQWTSHHSSQTYLGVQLGEAENGVKVLDVMVDSPAHKIGLKRGDIITEVNGAHTRRSGDLMTLLSFFDPNDKVEIQYIRNGQSKKTKVTLGERSYK